MATARSAAGSIFDLVKSLANTTVKAVGTIDNGLGMVTRTIDNAAHNQKFRIAASQESYGKQTAMQLEQELEAIDDWCSEVEGRADRLNSTYEKLVARTKEL